VPESWAVGGATRPTLVFRTAARQFKRYRVYHAILSKNPFMGEDISVPAEGKSRQSHTVATRIDPKKDLSLAF
jgi:hypothetical protein